MKESIFVLRCKLEIIDYVRHACGTHITDNDVHIVWQCKILQNYKALLHTSLLNSPYFEITYNGDKDELYVDVYKKVSNYSPSI